MSKSLRLTVEEAAPILGRTPNYIRYYMRKERSLPMNERTLPIGQARKASSGKSFLYDIYKPLVARYLGLDEWPEEVKES